MESKGLKSEKERVTGMEKYDEEEKLIMRVEAGERGHIVLWKRNTAQISAEADSPLTGIRGATVNNMGSDLGHSFTKCSFLIHPSISL